MLPSYQNSKSIGSLKRTSPCRTSASVELGNDATCATCRCRWWWGWTTPRPKGRNDLPSRIDKAMLLISNVCCLNNNRSLRKGSSKNWREERFQQEVMKGKRTGDMEVCGTPTRWIHEALGTHDEKNCEQDELRVMSNMFPESAGTKSCHLYDMIYLRDVIMNRSSEPATRGANCWPQRRYSDACFFPTWQPSGRYGLWLSNHDSLPSRNRQFLLRQGAALLR